MTGTEERELADRILAARASRTTVPAPGGHRLDAAAAYRVQRLVTAARLERGEVQIGWKLGYTSEPMRQQMGVAEPNLGPLTSAMILESPAVVTSGVTQPRAEPEVAAVMGDGGAVREWRAALEVVDSVWTGYDFDWALNTADGSSAAFVVLGSPIDGARLPDLGVELEVDGEVVSSGAASAAMGHPLHALVWLADRLSERGDTLRPGDIVITGGLTRAVALSTGTAVTARFADGSSASVRRAAAP